MRMCEAAIQAPPYIYQDAQHMRELFVTQLAHNLQGSFSQIQSVECSTEQKETILMELAEASKRCYPTWLEMSRKMLAYSHGKTETVAVKVLRMVQEYKEQIILDFCQNELDMDWHGVNIVRQSLGIDLGLSTDTAELDPYAVTGDGSIFGPVLIKWLFLQRYQDVNQLVAYIQAGINAQPYDSAYHDYLLTEVKQMPIKEPEDYVAGHFYDEDYKLQFEAVALMLRNVGVLK